jgi:hypothetical protein
VIARQRSKVGGVARDDDRAAESHRRGDDRRVDSVRGIQIIPAEQYAGDPRRAMVEVDNPVASTNDPINADVAPGASVDLHQHRGGHANQRIPPGCLVEHGLGSSSGDTSIAS